MHEAAFAKAALPAPARVLGLNLRPFSLAHELWLIREQNPLSIHHSGDLTIETLKAALPEAVLICAQRHEEIRAMSRDLFIGLKLWLWRRRLRDLDGDAELAAFLEYRTLGTLNFPDEPADGEPGRELGAPLLLTLHAHVMSLGHSESLAWDYPYGLAQMRFAAAAEMQNRLKIKNRFEAAHDQAFAEWEKQHPGNTLKFEGGRNA